VGDQQLAPHTAVLTGFVYALAGSMVTPTSSMLLAAAPAPFALSQTKEANPSGDHFAHLAQPKIDSTDAFQRLPKILKFAPIMSHPEFLRSPQNIFCGVARGSAP